LLLLCTLKQIAPKSNLFLKSCWLVKLWIWKFLNKNRTRKNCFRYLKHMSPLNAAICTTISYTLWVEWYYLKNKYMTLRSKVKVPQRSLWYATHRLVVMHPHTKYHWPISKDKNVMARTRKYYLIFFIWPWGQRSRSHEGHYSTQHTTLWSCTHIPNIIELSGKTKKLWSGQSSLRRSRRKNQTKTICLPTFEGET
jgi:hypothetical protein